MHEQTTDILGDCSQADKFLYHFPKSSQHSTQPRAGLTIMPNFYHAVLTFERSV